MFLPRPNLKLVFSNNVMPEIQHKLQKSWKEFSKHIDIYDCGLCGAKITVISDDDTRPDVFYCDCGTKFS